jgi:elongation factor 1 alpha-like protein
MGAPPPSQKTPREDERERLIASFDASRPASPPLPSSKPVGISVGGGKKTGTVSIGSARSSPVPPPSSGRPQSLTPTPDDVTASAAAAQAAAAPAIVGPTTGKRAKISKELMSSLQNQRSRLSMVVLGHVDAGKSTLMGQVLLKLGHVQKRTITKYQKQAAELGKASFALAWVMDEDDSERERGVTMDIGTKWAKTPTHDLTILDAPGHADFVPAMITGAASADVGLLVVAATPGEFEAGFEPSDSHHRGGQTREHIILSRGLGVSQLLVAVNKLDAADPSWSQGRFEEIKGKVLPFLQANGFKPHRVRFVPVSGLTGTNVKDPPTSDDAAALKEWYDGPTLLDAIDGFFPANRKIEEPMRIIVSDLFPEGKGITAKGRCIQGICSVGDQVIVLPVGDVATVGRIEHGKAQSASNPYGFAKDESGGDETEGAERAKVAVAGDCIDIYLSGIDIARIHPGNVLSHVDPDLRPAVKKKFRASLMVMDDLAVPIIRGAQALLHMHSIDTPAVVSKLICTKNRDGSVKRQKPRVLAGGASASVEISLDQKISISKYADCRALGRFVLRRGGDTIAVGIIDEILG